MLRNKAKNDSKKPDKLTRKQRALIMGLDKKLPDYEEPSIGLTVCVIKNNGVYRQGVSYD